MEETWLQRASVEHQIRARRRLVGITKQGSVSGARCGRGRGKPFLAESSTVEMEKILHRPSWWSLQVAGEGIPFHIQMVSKASKIREGSGNRLAGHDEAPRYLYCRSLPVPSLLHTNSPCSAGGPIKSCDQMK
jgi:hypothetical protein